MAPEKLSDAAMEFILWRKVLIALQKEMKEVPDGYCYKDCYVQKLHLRRESVIVRELGRDSLKGTPLTQIGHRILALEEVATMTMQLKIVETIPAPQTLTPMINNKEKCH